jgi:hypothetical protein
MSLLFLTQFGNFTSSRGKCAIDNLPDAAGAQSLSVRPTVGMENASSVRYNGFLMNDDDGGNSIAP